MAKTCADVERLLAGRPEVADLEIECHLAGCESCRSQWAAHRVLRRTLSDSPLPALEPGFTHNLMARIERQPEVAPQLPLMASWGLRLYWLATALLSAAVVAGIDWREAFTLTPWLPRLLLLPLLGLPLVLLLLDGWRPTVDMTTGRHEAGRRAS
jgi:hypothetical protein